MNLRRFAHTLELLAAAALFVLPPAAQAAPPSGGGGSKVSVTAANPADAFQGEELDVIISGSGFDAGSQVSYLVTGTTDGSQVEVLSVQYISSTELKTRIRPKDAALPTEYDIQVQTSSGRKGKGTTLFRVKVAETVCTGSEPKEPEIAYLTTPAAQSTRRTSTSAAAPDATSTCWWMRRCKYFRTAAPVPAWESLCRKSRTCGLIFGDSPASCHGATPR
jgi:hypothetical protein